MITIYRLNKDDVSTILHYTGQICLLLGIVMLIPILISLIYDEREMILPFVYSGLFSILIGLLLSKIFKKKSRFSLRNAMVFSTIIWLVSSALGALPFYLSGELSYLNSFFEAMSGFTTTGFSMFSNLDTVCYTINFWRGFTQWLGGIGIISIFLIVLSAHPVNITRMYIAEGRDERIFPSVSHTIKIILYIYLFYTTISIILFKLAGMPIFDSIFHTFTALSTGGFGMHNSSLFYYHNIWIEIVAMIIMMIGATNFALHYTILKGNWKDFFRDIEPRLAYPLLIIATILVTIILYKNHIYGDNLFLTIRYSLFQVVSASSTTGLQTTSSTDILTKWLGLGQFLIILLMIIGAATCSTGGGIKSLRVGLLVKGIWWQIKHLLLPRNAVIPEKIHHISDIHITEDIFRLTGLFVFTYLLIYLLSVIIVLMYYPSIGEVMFEVASALGNVGLSVGLVTPTSPYIVKLVFIIDFWVGRLEIWPILLSLTIFIVNVARR